MSSPLRTWRCLDLCSLRSLSRRVCRYLVNRNGRGTLCLRSIKRSDYCQFLFYCLWWTLLRGGLSVPAVYKNERIFQTLLDIMYPAIVCSFLLLLKHYAKVVVLLLVSRLGPSGTEGRGEDISKWLLGSDCGSRVVSLWSGNKRRV